MILEGIVTTRNIDGSTNLAPMGPIVEPSFGTAGSKLILRPFQTAKTFENLSRTRCGVFHVTDDVLLLAQAAVHQWVEPPVLDSATAVEGERLADCCRFFEFTIESIDDSAPRSTMVAIVRRTEQVRPFFGLNRAMFAVLEAAILSTRTHLIPAAEIEAELSRLRPLIVKTAGPRESAAFELIERYIQTLEPAR